jgi:hypothetical protein
VTKRLYAQILVNVNVRKFGEYETGYWSIRKRERYHGVLRYGFLPLLSNYRAYFAVMIINMGTQAC